jgi:hypothetical protein
MDFLSLGSRPASLGSRIYFSFVLCFELFVSKPSVQLLMQASDKLFTGIYIFLLHSPPSPCASRAPNRLIHLPFQHTKRKHLFTTLTFSPTFIPRHRQHQHQHPTLSRSARTTRRPLPLLSPPSRYAHGTQQDPSSVIPRSDQQPSTRHHREHHPTHPRHCHNRIHKRSRVTRRRRRRRRRMRWIGHRPRPLPPLDRSRPRGAFSARGRYQTRRPRAWRRY